MTTGTTPTPITPTVGMLATYGIGSDAYAMVITAVSRTGHRVEAMHIADETDPTSILGNQVRTFTRRRNGKYRSVGANYDHLGLGYARNYRDPSF